MRLLSSEELRCIAGGENAGGEKVAPLKQVAPNVWVTVFNGYKTTVVCNTPSSFSFNFGISTSGKLVNLETGGAYNAPSNCTVTTLNTKSGIQSTCSNNQCTVTDLSGQKTSQTTVESDDSGLAQLAAAENTTAEAAAGDEGDSEAGTWLTLPNMVPEYGYRYERIA